MENKKFNTISVINFAKEAIKYVINPNERYIRWGEDNKLPFNYLRLYDEVPEHTSSIDFITNLVSAEGITSTKLDYWTTKKVTNDFILFGGYALQVSKTRGGGFVYTYVDISKCRLNLEKTKVGYSEDWNKYKQEIKWFIKSPDSTTEGIYIYKSNNCRDIYPKPYYTSAIKSLSTMSYITDYHNNNAANGFSPSVIVNFNNGIPDAYTQRKIENGIKEKFTGEKGQKFIMSFNESPETKTTIDRLTSDNLDEKFESLQKFIQNQIIISHKITSGTLIGIKPENQGFSKTEFTESLDVFKEVIINGFQKELEYSLSIILGEDIKIVEKTNITPNIGGNGSVN